MNEIIPLTPEERAARVIDDVVITNWQAPGREWWAAREANPKEPLAIHATFILRMSYEQYHAFCDLVLKCEAVGKDPKADEPITLV